ncbi:helix-turn-helix transcriptional regulator [Paenibacillus psychroresistens]|nr:AraC family transcriptional regulator [Paenibacillus psychroresistens]
MFIREYNHYISDRPDKTSGGVHPYHEILYISSGEFIIHWIGNTYKAQGPALFIFSPSSPHHIEQVSQHLHSWFIELRLQEMDYIPSIELLHLWNTAQSSIHWDHNELSDIYLTLKAMDVSILNNLPEPTKATFFLSLTCDIQKLFLLINHFVTKSHPKISSKTLSPFLFDKWSSQSYIYDLIRHIEDNYQQDITLDELSKRSGYTPSYIIRLFKEMTDLTPLQYMYELRLNAATAYLLSTSMSIQEIAESTGFPTIHYFSRMFKKKFGQSPKAWKNAQLHG